MNENNQSLQVIKEELKNEVEKSSKNIGEKVLARLNSLKEAKTITLPEGYNAGNALYSAYLILKNTIVKDKGCVLDFCNQVSVANALLDMTIQGLYPGKNQGYFIPYNDRLTWQPSVFGKCACIKRCKGVDTEPIATLIYKDDEVVLGHNELGDEVITEHKTSFANKDKGIVGCYATFEARGQKRSAVMTIREIKEAWSMSKASKDHQQFTGEFCKRTVINRLIKYILQSSNDDDLLAEDLIENEEQHYNFENVETVEDLNAKADIEVKDNANTGEVVDIDEETGEVEEVPAQELNDEVKQETKKARPF